VEVVESDEDDEDAEGAGEADRGDDDEGIGVRGGDGGRRDCMVSACNSLKDEIR